MRIPVSIIVGALLIAASVPVVGRYSIGRVAIGTGMVTVFGIDQWTDAPFMRQAPTN